MANRRSAAPIIAAVLLLLPVLYVGSYLALVRPPGVFAVRVNKGIMTGSYFECYRCGGEVTGRVFWPLEQIDRRVRPGAWNSAPWNYERTGRAPILPPR